MKKSIMKRVSIDNGANWCTPEDALASLGMDQLLNFMEQDTMEWLENNIICQTNLQYLEAYLLAADNDLIIG